jgi:hypothetical protein
MPIEDDTVRPSSSPVLTRTAIGQHFIGVTCAFAKPRDRKKTDPVTHELVPIVKPNGKIAQELVVTLLTMPGTTMPTGKIGEHRTPIEGEVVRAILKGKSYGDWIDAETAFGKKIGVGYIVEWTVDRAQTYDENGNPVGPELTTQAECDAVPRARTLGFYGPLTVRTAVGAEVAWDDKACAFHREANRPEPVPVPAGDIEPPF